MSLPARRSCSTPRQREPAVGPQAIRTATRRRRSARRRVERIRTVRSTPGAPDPGDPGCPGGPAAAGRSRRKVTELAGKS